MSMLVWAFLMQTFSGMRMGMEMGLLILVFMKMVMYALFDY
jgi:hypothetical protein